MLYDLNPRHSCIGVHPIPATAAGLLRLGSCVIFGFHSPVGTQGGQLASFSIRDINMLLTLYGTYS